MISHMEGIVPQPKGAAPVIEGVNVITGLVDETELSFTGYEKYLPGINQTIKGTLDLAEDDFRIGRVKNIFIELSGFPSATIHFIYEPLATHVFNDPDQLTTFRYSETGLIDVIEYFERDSSGGWQLNRRERIYWMQCEPTPHLMSILLENANGEVMKTLCFHYNIDGQLQQLIKPDGESVDYIYNEEGSLQGLRVSNDVNSNEDSQFYSFDGQEIDEQSLLALHDFDESISSLWNTLSSFFFSCFQYLQLSAHQAKIKLGTELKIPSEAKEAMESVGKTLLGESTYLLMGPHYEETQIAHYGEREISDKVRVTFINGILNTRTIIKDSLSLVSDSHGGIKVHYVFRPTEGWTWDISRGIMIKIAYMAGFRSLHAHLLVQLWRVLIEEMGGVGGGGTVVHYAHSLGGSETDRARDLLTPEEQKMIRVITFGSSTLVRNEGFQFVVNHVSLNDGVSSVFLEPFGHIRNYFDPDSNVRFYESDCGARWWPVDHLLNGPTYGPLLRQMGVDFVAEFGED